MENDIEIKEEKPRFSLDKKKICKIASIALPLLLILCSFAVVIYYILGPAEGYFHSDCTDTILWAQATYDSGKLISDNFKYAALLPFGGNLLMLPFIPIFGVSMTTHNIGMVLFAVLFFLSLYALARSLGYNLAKTSFIIFAVTMVLSGSDKLREIMWGHIIYYSLGLLFLAFGLYLVNKTPCDRLLFADKTHRVKDIVLMAGLFVFSALTATNGLQSVVTYILPVVGALILERIFAETEEKPLMRTRWNNMLTLVAVFLASTIAGLLLLKLLSGDVQAGYANAYSCYSGMNTWKDNLLKFGGEWFSLIGVSVKDGDDLVSIESIGNLIRIFTGIFILILPIIGACLYKKIESRGSKLVLLAHFVQSALILFGYIFGRLNSANWRLTPMLGTAVLASAVTVCELIKPQGFALVSKRFAVLSLCLLCLAPIVSVRQITKMPADYGRDNDLHRVAEKLEELDLKYGYAEFWKSQAITVLSDSKLKVRNIQIVDGTLQKYEYQSEYTWFDDQPDVSEYFILLSDYEFSLVEDYIDYEFPFMRVYNIDGYKVVVLKYNLFGED